MPFSCFGFLLAEKKLFCATFWGSGWLWVQCLFPPKMAYELENGGLEEKLLKITSFMTRLFMIYRGLSGRPRSQIMGCYILNDVLHNIQWSTSNQLRAIPICVYTSYRSISAPGGVPLSQIISHMLYFLHSRPLWISRPIPIHPVTQFSPCTHTHSSS